jgi:hypothetical protein
MFLKHPPQIMIYSLQYYAAVVSNNQGTYLVTGDTCVSFPSGIDKDSYWNTTQAFAIVAAVIGGLACIGSCVLPCFDDQKPKLWKVIGLVFILCSLFQGLTLLFLSSDICKDNQVLALLPQAVRSLYPEECSLSSGTKMNISAVVFWFVAGVLAVFVGNAMAASTGSGENPDSSPGEPVTKMPKEEDAEVGEEGPTE